VIERLDNVYSNNRYIQKLLVGLSRDTKHFKTPLHIWSGTVPETNHWVCFWI